jgi:hypothetical protein
MLRVIVELVPGGREAHKREIASMTLANVTAQAGLDDYAIHAAEGVNAVAQREAWETRGLIAGHDRQQTVWALIAKAAAWASLEAEKR